MTVFLLRFWLFEALKRLRCWAIDSNFSLLSSAQNLLAGPDRGISSARITLDIFCPDVPDLTLIDLPGITRLVIGGQNEGISQQVGASLLCSSAVYVGINLLSAVFVSLCFVWLWCTYPYPALSICLNHKSSAKTKALMMSIFWCLILEKICL